MSRNLGAPCADKQPYYFISYNSEDEARVAVYVSELVKLNIPIWYDNGIKTGDEWEMEIAERIDKCVAVIMFLSKNIFLKERSYVHKEFNLATQYSGKKVYVVMLDNINKPEVPVRYRAWWDDVSRLQGVEAYRYSLPGLCIKNLVSGLEVQKSYVQHTEDEKPSDKDTERIMYENGDIYEGGISNGRRNGKGKMIFRNKDVYEGEFKDDKIEGSGKFTFVEGASYTGELKNGKMHGKGKYAWANGSVYEGDFVDGKRTGMGKYTESNGEIYEGHFVDGIKTGRGKYTWPDGTVYIGNFIEGKRTGKGKMLWPSGGIYKGDFVDGKRNGKGKYIRADGAVYDGEYKNDKRHGIGKYTEPGGYMEKGIFENGKFKGE